MSKTRFSVVQCRVSYSAYFARATAELRSFDLRENVLDTPYMQGHLLSVLCARNCQGVLV